jgi:zinc protease
MLIDWSAAQLPAIVERLANGLTVVAHSEPKSPVVAVYVGYRAGSRDEPASKAGLAHLAEHLMFAGTKNNPGSYFARFEEAGAAWMNAFVKEDYSAYFATVPVDALDLALSMEADRLAYLAEALSEENIERQREVVLNELRQRESEPYGSAKRILAELAHSPGHPYAHPPDGLIAGLGKITAGDVREWIVSQHVPAKAYVILAGAIEPRQAIQQVQHHFGTIAAKSTAQREHVENTSAAASRRQIQLTVSLPRLCVAWIGPSFVSAEYPAFEAASEILAGAKGSRLWRRIVLTERLASEIAVELRPRELGSLLTIHVTGESGSSLSIIESIVRREIERLSAELPTADELNVARLRLFGKMVRGFERTGGPQSKSDLLGQSALIGGSPDLHRQHLSRLAGMELDAISAATRRWLAGESAVLEILPTA